MTKKQQERQTEKAHGELASALADRTYAKLEHSEALRELIRALKAKAKQESKSQR